jgi:hypothetical protein
MVIRTSHVLPRSKKSEAYASILVEWLNNTASEHARSRVVEIVETFGNSVQFGWRDLAPVSLGRWSKLRPTKVQAENTARLAVLSRRLDAALRRYRFSPQRRAKASGGWGFGWKHSISAGALDIVLSGEGDTLRVTEGDAVLRLLRIIEEGHFHRLRKCHYCSKWLFARFKHQRYCGKKCQMTAYKSTQEWKTKRRKYMRDYLKLKASGKVR